MAEHPRPLGAIPRRPDPRDYMMSDVPPKLKNDTQNTWQRPILLDQGAYGTCVANAWTHFLTDTPIQHPDKGLLNPADQPSYATGGTSAYWPAGYHSDPIAAELYALRLYDRIHDGVLEPLDPTRDAGAQADDGARVLVRRGLVSAYYRAASVDDVVQAILTKAPVVFASPWYNSMDAPHKPWNDTSYLTVDPASGLRGYHCYVLFSVNLAPLEGPPFVGLQNSWGPWGTHGGARVSIEDLHTLYIQNAWIATEAPLPPGAS
jgi:hypothetical protein